MSKDPTDPPTTGEIVRRLNRMEETVLTELRSMRSGYVPRELFEEKIDRLTDDLEELESDLTAQAVTRRQLVIGFLLLVLGEIVALTVALSNLAARATGLTG